MMINFKDYLTEAKKKKTKSRKDRFTWKDGDVTVTKSKELHEKTIYGKSFDEPHHERENINHDDRDSRNKAKIATDQKFSDEGEEHHKKLSAEYAEHGRKLSPEHHNSVAVYKGPMYKAINHPLRHNGEQHKHEHYRLADEEHKKHVERLDHVTGNHKTTKAMHVYRGFDGHNIHHLDKGDVLHDKGYTSTTVKHNRTNTFSSWDTAKHDGKEKRVVAKIHVPKGTKGYYLDNEAHTHGSMAEKEFLLHRGTHFKVLGHTHDPVTDTHTVHMKVHKQDD